MNKITFKDSTSQVEKYNKNKKGLIKRSNAHLNVTLSDDDIIFQVEKMAVREKKLLNDMFEQIPVNGGMFKTTREIQCQRFGYNNVKTISRHTTKAERLQLISVEQRVNKPNEYMFGQALQSPSLVYRLMNIFPALKYYQTFSVALLLAVGACISQDVPHSINELLNNQKEEILYKNGKRSGEFTWTQQVHLQYIQSIAEEPPKKEMNSAFVSLEEFGKMIDEVKKYEVDYDDLHEQYDYEPRVYVPTYKVSPPKIIGKPCCEFKQMKNNKRIEYLRSKLIGFTMKDSGPSPIDSIKRNMLTCSDTC